MPLGQVLDELALGEWSKGSPSKVDAQYFFGDRANYNLRVVDLRGSGGQKVQLRVLGRPERSEASTPKSSFREVVV
ncbi:MAG: hypothetical protein ACOC9J_03490 [Persicimonas sp.]